MQDWNKSLNALLSVKGCRNVINLTLILTILTLKLMLTPVSDNDKQAFKTAWDQIASQLNAHQRVDWTAEWELLHGPKNSTNYTTLSIQPLSAHQCREPRHCVGLTNHNMDCACYV